MSHRAVEKPAEGCGDPRPRADSSCLAALARRNDKEMEADSRGCQREQRLEIAVRRSAFDSGAIQAGSEVFTPVFWQGGGILRFLQ